MKNLLKALVVLVLALNIAFISTSCEPSDDIKCRTVIEKTVINGKFVLVFADKPLVVGGRDFEAAIVGQNWCTYKN